MFLLTAVLILLGIASSKNSPPRLGLPVLVLFLVGRHVSRQISGPGRVSVFD